MEIWRTLMVKFSRLI